MTVCQGYVQQARLACGDYKFRLSCSQLINRAGIKAAKCCAIGINDDALPDQRRTISSARNDGNDGKFPALIHPALGAHQHVVCFVKRRGDIHNLNLR